MAIRRVSAPGGRGLVGGILLIAAFAICGVALLASGLSELHNAHAIETSGMPAEAVVTATSGYGSTTIQVGYTTAAGSPEKGTVSVESASDFTVGEPVAVVYDSADPSVVSLAGKVGSTTDANAEIGVGSLLLAILAASFVLGGASSRRRHRQRVRAIVGP